MTPTQSQLEVGQCWTGDNESRTILQIANRHRLRYTSPNGGIKIVPVSVFLNWAIRVSATPKSVPTS